MECGFSADVKTFRSLQMNWIWNKSETIKVTGKCFSKTLASIKITQYKFVLTLTKLWIEMTTVTSVVMKAQPIPPIIWPSTIIWRSDLMRAFHYFFFQRRDYTYTLQKEKDWKKTDKGKLSESVTWGAWGDTGNTFLFSFTKNGTLKKKNRKKVQQKVCISTKLQHTSRTAAQDVISAVSWITGRENWYWCRMKLFQSPSDYDTLSQLQANRRRVGMRVGRNQT